MRKSRPGARRCSNALTARTWPRLSAWKGLAKRPSLQLSRGGEEVPPAVPVLHLVHTREPDVGFVNQGRGLECLAGPFVGHLLDRESVPVQELEMWFTRRLLY